ncbi:ATP-binding protein [Marinilabilia sp.]|uniref:ATP-binding protein n=1 Tax=Marinilabilia sp. TaxID=2021252 RepID=UPI0025BB9808|nr:ATP-binding protein [Marinilabilia sp.]
MDRVTIKQISNAFIPAREIDDSEKFAGRSSYIQNAFFALNSKGNNIAIVGARGIGKSSLSRQIINLSQGDNSLLEKLEIFYDDSLDYLSLYIACGNKVKTIDDLLIRLLTRRDCLLEWVYDIPAAKKELDKLSGGFDVKVLKAGAEHSGELTNESVIKTHEVDVIFENIIKQLNDIEIAKDGILIVIDEFDQIENPEGFAKLLKSLATNSPSVKFCVVGVAQDLQNLLKEHGSTDRLFADSVINLPSMSDIELDEIISNAEGSIKKFITFDEGARKKMIELANGHPYLIHLIGKQALKTAYLNNIQKIDHDYIESTLKEIAEKETDPVLEGRFKKAVASSYQREAVLRAMAQSVKSDGEVWTTDAYKIALDYGIENASQYVGHLVTDEYGAELIKLRERYYRFKDSLFQTYIKARPWMTSDK